jgi:hypothetical protein
MTAMNVSPVRVFAAAKVGFGLVLIARPGFASKAWVGEPAQGPARSVLIRALGARELALGAGLLTAPASRQLLMLGAFVDAVDAVAAATSPDLDARHKRFATVSAAVYAGLGLLLANKGKAADLAQARERARG